MTRVYFFLLLAAGITLFSGQALAQLVIYVSPIADSKVTFADLKNNPSAPVTLSQALAMLKAPALRDSSGTRKESVTIHLAAGTYRLVEALHLDPASSGSPGHLVSIEGPKDASAVISGGRVVSGFTVVTDPATLARLPAGARTHVLQANLVGQGVTDFGGYKRRGFGRSGITAALEMFYRAQPMPLARWPNEGYAKISATPDGDKGRTFTVEGTNVKVWKGEAHPLATGYWFNYWADETIPIEAIDSTTGQFTLPPPAPRFGIKPGQPVLFQNILAELDQPEEWYLDSERGMLYFWPPGPWNENDVEISMLDKLLVVSGASYIRISGVTFENARGDAITVNGGQHVSISNSIIRNVGSRAAVINGKSNGLADMLIENTGEGGVVLAGGDRKTLTAANLYVERSTIRRFGRLTRTYQPGVLIAGTGNRVVGNRISDAPHSAILFYGNDHLIAENEIADVCKETGDAGAIYTGRDWTARGTVISGNHIHDILPNVTFGKTKSVYLDDQASGITVRDNLFERVLEAVFIGGGRDNLVENNKFINTPTAIHLDARGKTWQKAATDDPNGTLRKRLTEVPYNQTPYKERYPHLANILDDEPGAPKYNIERKNVFVGNSTIRIIKGAEAGIRIENSNNLQSARP